MNEVVITGADGFIGRHLVRALSARGVGVWALVVPRSPLRGHVEDLPGVTIVECDLMDLAAVSDRIPSGSDAFVHLAWAGVAPECRDDVRLQARNVDFALAALDFAAAKRAGRFVIPGSTMEYSLGGKVITGQGDVPTPQNAYGAAKIAARYLCEAAARNLRMPFIYTIFSGVYGADRRDSNVIFYTIEKLLRGESPELTKLEQPWDYVHVDDLVAGLVAVCEKGVPGRTYPIGRGDNVPLRRYVEQIHELIAPSIPLGIGKIPYRSDVLPWSCVDITRLREDTGFSPQIPFNRGIAEVIGEVRRSGVV